MPDEKKEEEERALGSSGKNEPLREVRCRPQNFRSHMDEMLARMPWPMWWPFRPIELSAEEPKTGIIDMETELKVVADLPGVEKEDIEINVTGDSIEISAESKAEKRERREGKYVLHEREYTSFKRVLALPEEVVPSKGEAMFNDGVLEVILPKKRPTPIRTKVKVGVK